MPRWQSAWWKVRRSVTHDRIWRLWALGAIVALVVLWGEGHSWWGLILITYLAGWLVGVFLWLGLLLARIVLQFGMALVNTILDWLGGNINDKQGSESGPD